MFQSLFAKIAWGIIRHTITTLGGGLVADGVLSNDENSQLVGAVMTVLGIAWSGYEKYKAHKNAVVATPAPASTRSDDLTGATATLTAVDVRPLAPIQ